MKIQLLLVVCLFLFRCMSAQQVPDTVYSCKVEYKTYKSNSPKICIDGTHHNFHTINEGFYAFAKLMRNDGYQCESYDKMITTMDQLKDCKVLVIVNPLHESNLNSWTLPTPSAFTEDEIEIINQWVKEGGSLLLIADHMPFAGAANGLAQSFGFEFLNGFAKTGTDFWPPSVFAKGMLLESPVTDKLSDDKKVNKVTSFTGSAFKMPETAIGVLKFNAAHHILLPDTAWVFNKNTINKSLDGFYQGALLHYGKGRVAVFGEAAMFTAQIVNGNTKVGFNSEYAPQNLQFILNVIHWLDK